MSFSVGSGGRTVISLWESVALNLSYTTTNSYLRLPSSRVGSLAQFDLILTIRNFAGAIGKTSNIYVLSSSDVAVTITPPIQNIYMDQIYSFFPSLQICDGLDPLLEKFTWSNYGEDGTLLLQWSPSLWNLILPPDSLSFGKDRENMILSLSFQFASLPLVRASNPFTLFKNQQVFISSGDIYFVRINSIFRVIVNTALSLDTAQYFICIFSSQTDPTSNSLTVESSTPYLTISVFELPSTSPWLGKCGISTTSQNNKRLNEDQIWSSIVVVDLINGADFNTLNITANIFLYSTPKISESITFFGYCDEGNDVNSSSIMSHGGQVISYHSSSNTLEYFWECLSHPHLNESLSTQRKQSSITLTENETNFGM
jgi:hypothetical protein